MDAHFVQYATDVSRRYDMVSFRFLRKVVGEGGLLRIGMLLDALFFYFRLFRSVGIVFTTENQGKMPLEWTRKHDNVVN